MASEYTAVEHIFAPPKPQQAKTRRRLFVLSATGLLVGVVFILYPFWPRLRYAVSRPNAITAASLRKENEQPSIPPANITDDRLLIPAIGVNIPIFEGNETALSKGAWRFPDTSADPLSGNMVLSAHRYKLLPPASETLYLLDKVVSGDTIVLDWRGKEYRYRVSESRVVKPDDLSVLAQTERPQLTLITCTPLFSTARRLVVTAKLVER